MYVREREREKKKNTRYLCKSTQYDALLLLSSNLSLALAFLVILALSSSSMAGNWCEYRNPDTDSQEDCHSNAALNYISQVLMDEECLDEHKCVFVESISYKAMEKVLAGILDNSSSSGCETASFADFHKFENEDEIEQQDTLTSQEMQQNEIDYFFREPPKGIAMDSEQYMKGNSFISTSLQYVPSSVEVSSKSFSIPRQFSPDSSQVLLDEFLAQGEVSVESSMKSSQVVRADISLFQGNINSDFSTHVYVDENHADQQSSESEALWSSDGNHHAEPERESMVLGDEAKSLPSAAGAQPNAVESSDPATTGLIPMLVKCAQALSTNDVEEARRLVTDIKRLSSPFGSWKQRLAHYFVEALAAKLSGNVALFYTSLTKYRPSVAEMLKTFCVYLDYTPYTKIPHFYATEIIVHACEGESRLHIIDFGIMYGIQWPCLIQALANRQGGPPRLRITGIDCPQPGFKPASRVDETGRWLAHFARLWGVPFEYHALAIKWENIQPASLHLRHDDEVLIVNCMLRLRHLTDETMMAESPRKIVLKKIRSMNPKIFVQGILSMENNSPFGFMNRFHESLDDYSNKFEAIDACISRDFSERFLMEQMYFGRAIINTLACEGLDRVERGEPYTRWQALTHRAGFRILPIHTSTFNKAKDLLKMFDKNFGMVEHGGWMLLGWKGRPTHCVSAWQI
ncbi:hypothetical protein O6H91_15G090500 [Diphasiastrum complanatum]|nr:hypothetical protein O6H91_15G090500 [Diphasiastrum complanatum]